MAVDTRHFESDPEGKREKRFHYDEATGEFGIESIQDVEPIIDLSRAEYKEYDARAPWKGDLHRVASIPLNVWAELERKGIAQDNKALLKWLDDPENMAFRVRPGRLSRGRPVKLCPDVRSHGSRLLKAKLLGSPSPK